MEDKVLNLYKNCFISYLISNLDLKKYDDMIEKERLYFSPSGSIFKNLGSNYFSLLNEFYLDKLEDCYKNILSSKSNIDDEVFLIVKETYKKVLKKDDSEFIMYNPPLPEHRVKNGSIVFEFVYGKNSEKLNEEEYLKNMKKQREFIDKISGLIIREVEEKLEVACTIFAEKRM